MNSKRGIFILTGDMLKFTYILIETRKATGFKSLRLNY